MYTRYLWSQSFLRDFDIRIPFDPSKCVSLFEYLCECQFFDIGLS